MSILRINQFSALPGKHTDLLHAFKTLEPIIRAMEGCESCEIFSNNETRKVVIIEHWRDITTHQAAIKLIGAKDFAGIMPLLAKPPAGKYYNAVEG